MSAVILLYHGVTGSHSSGIEGFSGKHVPEKEFACQMDFLSRHATVMTLRRLAAVLQEKGPLPERSVAVTFDDTFKNVRDTALPVLKKYRVPATFFISTGFIGSNRRFWVDLVENMINKTGREHIEIILNDIRKTFPLRDRDEKILAVIQIKAAMKQMPPVKRDETLSVLKKITKVEDNGDDVPNYANLTWDDVRALDSPPEYEVGGHTVNHEILSYLDDDRLEYEIVECKKALETHLGHSIVLFSYPEGQPEHFNERVITQLKQAGIKICPSAISGVNPPGTDPFHLKRIMVGYMGEEFPFPDYKAFKDREGFAS